MKHSVVLDTGPLVALLKRRDRFHSWTVSALETVQPPLLTCESVITEACFLLRQTYAAHETVMDFMAEGYLEVHFSLSDEAPTIKTLLTRYQSVPMSLADACLVRMAELNENRVIMTLDSDFKIYRMNRNQTIQLLMPKNV